MMNVENAEFNSDNDVVVGSFKSVIFNTAKKNRLNFFTLRILNNLSNWSKVNYVGLSNINNCIGSASKRFKCFGNTLIPQPLKHYILNGLPNFKNI